MHEKEQKSETQKVYVQKISGERFLLMLATPRLPTRHEQQYLL